MKKNMSQMDRIIRILLFVLSIALFAEGSLPAYISITLMVVTTVLAVTSFVGYCLIYGLFNWSTLKK